MGRSRQDLLTSGFHCSSTTEINSKNINGCQCKCGKGKKEGDYSDALGSKNYGMGVRRTSMSGREHNCLAKEKKPKQFCCIFPSGHVNGFYYVSNLTKGPVFLSTHMLSYTLTCVASKSARAQGGPTVKLESALGLSGGLLSPLCTVSTRLKCLRFSLRELPSRGCPKWSKKIELIKMSY